MRHECDARCVCPVHRTPLLYAPAGDEHACQDIDCIHGHGMREDWTAWRPRTRGPAEWDTRTPGRGPAPAQVAP